MNMPHRVAPARYNRATQYRRALTAKVHLAKKALGLSEDDYRATLLRLTGHSSSTDCSEAQLVKLIDHFKSSGFVPTASPKSAKTRRQPADHPSARKARALWISLYHLGSIDNPSEAALEAFARRQLKVAALQWADQAQCYKLVEALKAMAKRDGWSQDVGTAKGDRAVHMLKVRLVEAIMAKLREKDIIPANWTISEAVFRLCGMETEFSSIFTTSELEQIAAHLGAKLREPVRALNVHELRATEDWS